MNTITEKKVSDTAVVAVTTAKEFYEDMYGHPTRVFPDDFVVCKWLDFHDGEKSNIEGKTTIAICRELEDAMLIFNSKE